jgi:hypothetical protein
MANVPLFFLPFHAIFTLMTIEDIALLCKTKSVRWTSHILERIFRRDIRTDDVINALIDGEIIEQYPSDYPFPSSADWSEDFRQRRKT